MIAYNSNEGSRHIGVVWYLWHAADSAHALGQLVSIDFSAAAPDVSDAARHRYDAAGNPVDRAELGFPVTNSFNNLNQIVTGSWTGSTVTVAGSVNYPAGTISVNNTPGTVYPDSSFDVPGVPGVPGTNTLTATYVGCRLQSNAGGKPQAAVGRGVPAEPKHVSIVWNSVFFSRRRRRWGSRSRRTCRGSTSCTSCRCRRGKGRCG